MRTTIAELVAILALDSTKFQQGITKAETSSMRMAKNLGAIGKRMTMMVTLPVVAAGVATTKMAMDFESQMANVFTLMDKATIKSRDWKKEVLDLSKKVPQSTDVLSKGLYDIVSAGIDAGKAMNVLEVSSKSATAGLTTTAVAADAITSVLNAYNLSADEAADVSDVLFTTIRYGKTTFAELGPQIGKVVATAAAAGVSFDEVGAALATMTISGLKTDQAIVGLNQTILSFLKPTDQAIEAAEEIGFELNATTLATKGLGGAMTELSQKMGITVDDMIEMEQAGLSDAEMYDELAVRTGKSAEMMASLFPNIRALKGALILAKDEGAKFNEMLDQQEGRLGATNKAFKTIAETAQFEFDLALSSLKATAIEMGSHLLPIASDLFKKIGELADQFGALSDSQQQTIIKTLGIIAVIGPLLYLTGKTITTVITLRKAILALNAAMKGMLGPFAIAVGILIAHGAYVKELSKNIENDYVQALVRGTSMITSITQATNTWQLATKVAEEKNLSLFKVLFSKRSTVQNMSDEIDRQAVLYNEVSEAALKYAQTFPEISRELQNLIDLYNDGELSQKAFEIGTQELIGTTQEYIKYQRLLNDAIKGREIEFYQEKIIALAKKLGIATDDSRDFADIQTDVEEALGITEGAADDAAGAIDGLRSSFNDLIDDIFGHITTYNDFQEANWAVEDAQESVKIATEELEKAQSATGKSFIKNDEALHAYLSTNEEYIGLNERAAELQGKLNGLLEEGKGNTTEYYNTQEELNHVQTKANEIVKKGTGLTGEYISTGKQSESQILAVAEATRKLEEKQNALDAANIKAIKTAFELSTQIGITIKEQEEAINKAFELGAEYVNSGEMGIETFARVALEFGLSSEDMISRAEEAGIDVNKYLREAADKSIEDFMLLATQFGLSGDEIIEKAEEIEINIDSQLRQAKIKGVGNFVELAKQFGLEGQSIIDKAIELGIVLDKETRDRILGIDTTEAVGNVKSLISIIERVKDKEVTIKAKYISEMGFQHGGVVPGPIGVPRRATVHGGEIIINPYEAGGASNIIPSIAVPEMKNVFPESLLIHNVIEMDKQVLADQINEIKIEESVTRVEE